MVQLPECAREHQNRPLWKVAPIPNTTPKTFYKSFIYEKNSTPIFPETFILIKLGENCETFISVQPLGCPNPRLASWTDFNARRLRNTNGSGSCMTGVIQKCELPRPTRSAGPMISGPIFATNAIKSVCWRRRVVARQVPRDHSSLIRYHASRPPLCSSR
jgi:hypothetical protein